MRKAKSQAIKLISFLAGVYVVYLYFGSNTRKLEKNEIKVEVTKNDLTTRQMLIRPKLEENDVHEVDDSYEQELIVKNVPTNGAGQPLINNLPAMGVPQVPGGVAILPPGEPAVPAAPDAPTAVPVVPAAPGVPLTPNAPGVPVVPGGSNLTNAPALGVNLDQKVPSAADLRTNLVSNNNILKKDWHDYTKIAEDNQRQGPGEKGAGIILSAEEKNSKQHLDLFAHNGFDGYASDKISLQRSLLDIRNPECRKKLYLENLPKVSVIIPFHEEHFSTLLRSVYSVVKRSPPELLEEIILVDDFSTKEFLKQQLEDHIKVNFKENLVKIIRLTKREGLIRTRMAGANVAKGDILIFFDSHIECNVNWLPPLIEPIVLNYTTVVCPFIDVINEETFAYSAQDEGARGAFDWELYYKRIPLNEAERKDPTEPFESPVMAGGLFAISKNWFNTLGGYDEGLEIWGGEQYELSFKIWQCGGRILDAPCSRIGHVYRKFNPFSVNMGVGDYLSKNYKRVAEIWMDEYKQYIYQNRPHMKTLDIGNITKQLEIRNRLQCRPFKWFMENVAYDLVKYYPPSPDPPYASGEIRNVESRLCIDTKFKGEQSNFGLDVCQSSNRDISGEQKFELTWRSDIRPRSRNVCFDASRSEPGAPVILFHCHGLRGNQEFQYSLRNLQIIHVISRQCLDSNTLLRQIFMNTCNSTLDSQKWTFENVNATLIRRDFKFE